VIGETGWRGIVKGAAGGRQRADLRRAVGHGIQRRRAAGGVIAGLRLAFKQQRLAVAGQEVAGGGPGNAGADDEVIALLHGVSNQLDQ